VNPQFDVAPARGRGLAPLFLISAAAVGMEIALTRYFATAKWSEYGYWVISIVMVGFALSGLMVALFRDRLVRQGDSLLAYLPAAIIIAGGLGYFAVILNPFNPLQMQNKVTIGPQLINIALYYVALLPYYFLTGLYISLAFILNADRVNQVYGFDLAGAGAGAALVLGLMFFLHPFRLPLALLPLPALAALIGGAGRWRAGAAALAALAASEALLLLGPQPTINEFKALYAPSHTQGAQRLAEAFYPSGYYALWKDFTERMDTDVSNNAGMMNVPGPPLTLGLYRDGNRIASTPRPGPIDVRYASATLAAAPYGLKPGARVLVVGGAGGFRSHEVLSLGARAVDVVETEPYLRAALKAAPDRDPSARLLEVGPVAAARSATAPYDIIDISADHIDAAEMSGNDLTAEAMAAYLKASARDGVVSIPVSIRDFPAYALRMIATGAKALRVTGVNDPERRMIVYRSAWNARILLSPSPWDAARIAYIRKWCDDRSFDVSYYPGMDVAAAREKLYNDLPSVSFATGETGNIDPDDAIADEALAAIKGQPTASGDAFRLGAITQDRPFYYALLRLDQPANLFNRLEVLPQAEIGGIVNVVVLGQAVILALLVLIIPVLAGVKLGRAELGPVWRQAVYFSALGLGFLLIEIYAIEKATYYLNDRTSAFALVLTSMLIFSGLGSLICSRWAHRPRQGVALAVGVVVVWCLLLLAGAQAAAEASLGLPWLARAALVLLATAPVSIALGFPFALGLGQLGSQATLPWAWALNGAFSVVATPVANLLAREAGLSRLLMLAALLYLITLLVFPQAKLAPPSRKTAQ
jgi:hypothetical protein